MVGCALDAYRCFLASVNRRHNPRQVVHIKGKRFDLIEDLLECSTSILELAAH